MGDDAMESGPVAWPPEAAIGQPSVSFELNMTPGLLSRELSALYLRVNWYWSVILFCLFLVAELLTLKDWSNPDLGLFLWPPGGAAFIALYFFLTGRSAGRKMFKTTTTWHSPMRIQVTSKRFYTSGPGFESAQDLALLHAVIETPESFLVYLNAAFTMIWPKRDLPDAESLNRLRDYLRNGLPGTAKIKLRG